MANVTAGHSVGETDGGTRRSFWCRGLPWGLCDAAPVAHTFAFYISAEDACGWRSLPGATCLHATTAEGEPGGAGTVANNALENAGEGGVPASAARWFVCSGCG